MPSTPIPSLGSTVPADTTAPASVASSGAVSIELGNPAEAPMNRASNESTGKNIADFLSKHKDGIIYPNAILGIIEIMIGVAMLAGGVKDALGKAGIGVVVLGVLSVAAPFVLSCRAARARAESPV